MDFPSCGLPSIKRAAIRAKGESAVSKVLITGTSKGIGYVTALLLARAGHEVIATMRSPSGSDLEKVSSEEKLPITVMSLDVDDDESVAELFGRVGPQVEVLVNNAGILSINAVEDESLMRFQQVMNTNYFGALRCIKEVLPSMRKRGSGCIVNVTSIAGRITTPASSAYTASKFALEALSETLAHEVKAHGIRVALVEPGIIDTPMTRANVPQYAEDTVYPGGRRLHAFYRKAAEEPADPRVVAEKIQHVIETPSDRLRFPVGPDSLEFLGWRSANSDETWIGLHALESDSEWFERVLAETGNDLRSV